MILALETSSSLCAVCILDESTGSVLGEISNDIGRGHAERLMDDILDVLKLAGIGYAELTSIATSVGPGSFTGIRVAVAAARGLGLALNVPVVGISTLQAIAWQAREFAEGRTIIVALDAGRDEIQTQTFDTAALPLNMPEASLLANFRQHLAAGSTMICGSATNLLEAHALSTGMVLHPSPIISTAAAVASAGMHPQMTVLPKPLYLRAPDAKTQTGFAVARTGH
jgi:tRNA threonylcarbamoyladenosine biosynthesis protein TsaB